MILEGVVTSQNPAGVLNVAPMGPIVDAGMQQIVLRPFQTSTTFRNLTQHPFAVLHVVDDVLLLARAAIGRLTEVPPTFPALSIPGRVLASSCRWYELRILSIDDSRDRSRIEAAVEHVGRLRDSFGFNRAKHAVLEAAIIATRIHLLPADRIRDEFDRLRSPVEKTAGPDERAAFALLDDFLSENLEGSAPAESLPAEPNR